MTTHRLLPSAVVCVPASQRADYAKVVGAGRVLTHPDSVIGLTPKLNWILRRFAKEDVAMFDDDLIRVDRCFSEKGEDQRVRDPRAIEEIVHATRQLAEDLGVYLFGWDSANSGTLYYTGLKPFALSGYITGCAKGFRAGHGLEYDERIVTKDDYDISALNARKHRMCLKNLRYSFQQKGTFANQGGLGAYRTSDAEKRDVELLKKKYGDVFRFGLRSGKRKRDYAGIEKISLSLPF